jgi:hypothetical protein
MGRYIPQIPLKRSVMFLQDIIDQGIRRISGGYRTHPRFSLCVGEIEIDDLSFDRQTDSAMVMSDPAQRRLTLRSLPPPSTSGACSPHPPSTTTIYLILFGFGNICCSIDQIIGISVSRSIAECYRSHNMFTRQSLSIQEE